MLDPAERKAMAEIKGFANHRDASQPQDPPTWKLPPTVIKAPSNAPLRHTRNSDQSRPQPSSASHKSSNIQSGTNPFSSDNLLSKKRQPGNPTAGRILTAERPAERLSKKPKLWHDQTFSSGLSDNRNLSTLAGSSRNTAHDNPRRSSITSEPEYISIEDDELYMPSTSVGMKRTYQERQSSDELILKSNDNISPQPQQSKYGFPRTIGRPTEKNSELVPDGRNTREIGKKYGSKDREETSSIESWGDAVRLSQARETRGNVKQIALHFEQIQSDSAPQGPKIDLSKLHSQPKKSKTMKPKDQLKLQALTPQSSKKGRQDPIATGTTLNKRGSVPVRELYIEQDKYKERPMEALFGSGNLLVVRDDDQVLFDLSNWTKKKPVLVSTMGVTPATIQITFYDDDCNPRLLTVILEDDETTIKNARLIGHLKKEMTQNTVVRHGPALWDMAKRPSEQAIKERGSSAKGKEPQSNTKAIPSTAQSIPIRFTPSDCHTSRTSDLRDESSEGKASRSTSNSRSNPPPIPNTVVPRRSTRNAPPEKPVDQDKVILVYPQGIPGAVNITNGDLARLQPGEYLNDTLIEFGLKLWHRQLEEKQPELAQQIHIFNSFFYKKLNNKKNELQAFETVRKWTSKFDIFQKKYIVVPINEHMHWYLAIIYEPEHVLSTTAPDESPVRKQTRLSVKAAPEEPISIPEKETEEVISSVMSVTSSEAEVEHNLGLEFSSQCNIEATVVVDDPVAEKLDAQTDDHDNLSDMYMSDPEMSSRRSTTRDNAKHSKQTSVDVDSMDIDDLFEEIKVAGKGGIVTAKQATASTSKQDPDRLQTIPPSKFYGSAKSKGKQKAKAEVDIVDMDADEARNNKKTYIFTFDSLGTNHPHAIKKLGQYLRMEAKDKKGIPNAGIATGRAALVPVQPNFCDCGVYLLHFAQTFLTDPKKYFNVIMSQSKFVTNPEKQEQWNDKQVAEMRDELSTQIRDLSTLWMKERALKEEEAKAQQGSKDPNQIDVDDSDSEIEMPTPVKKTRAARMRG